ncbi:hypothetical protein EON80_01785 [bacterium]|nr:MAG: hypothetical protein EON80_01785 [bacterium]
MKKSLFPGAVALLSLSLVAGCSTLQETNAQIDEGVHAPKRSMDMAKAIETDSNINQINMALGMVKGDNEGKAPATIDDAKKAAKVPSEMWTDGETGLPLEYDPVTGTVHRKGAAANSAPHAGAVGAPGRINVPGGGGN